MPTEAELTVRERLNLLLNNRMGVHYLVSMVPHLKRDEFTLAFFDTDIQLPSVRVAIRLFFEVNVFKTIKCDEKITVSTQKSA